ncbi:hypothetical protein OSTOST_15774 [Ostertagia ostertagi]
MWVAVNSSSSSCHVWSMSANRSASGNSTVVELLWAIAVEKSP